MSNNNNNNNQSISLVQIVLLCAEKVHKQISVSNQLYYSCDIWPITGERQHLQHIRQNTCADIIRRIHNVNIIGLL